MSKHTPGAMRAAERIATRWQLGPNTSTRILIATLIDRETHAPELVEALREAQERLTDAAVRIDEGKIAEARKSALWAADEARALLARIDGGE